MPDSGELQSVISRLENVRSRGKSSYTARCPAHADRTASLSVSQGEHGVVAHCFAGCQVDDVLGAIGLTMSDLFPPRERAAMTPAERSQARLAAQQAGWAAALTTLAQDTLLVQACAGAILRGHPLLLGDHEALAAAAMRIYAAKDTLCGRR